MTHSMITDDDFSSPAVVRALEAALRAELSAVRSSEEDLRRICQDLNIENAVLRTRHLQGKLSKPPADAQPSEAWLARMLNESDKKLTQVTAERDMLKYARKRDTVASLVASLVALGAVEQTRYHTKGSPPQKACLYSSQWPLDPYPVRILILPSGEPTP